MSIKHFAASISLVLLALCQMSGAQQIKDAEPATLASDAADGIYSLGNGTASPALTFKIDPGYTRTAQKLRAQGAVGISMVVGQDGMPQDIRVTRPLGYGLDEKAVEAVQKWRFNPGTNGGRPVRVRAKIEVNFRLNRVPGVSSWYSGQMTFVQQGNGKVPEVLDGAMPAPDKVMSSESAIFEFTVTASGSITNIRSTHGSQPSTDLLARSLAKWKFRPAMMGGQSVEASGVVRFVKGEGDDAVRLFPVLLPRLPTSSTEPKNVSEKSPPPPARATARTGEGASLDGRLRRIAEKDLVVEISSGRLLRFRLLAKTEFRDKDGRPVRDSLLRPGDYISVGVNPDDIETAIYITALESATSSEREAAASPVEAAQVAAPDSSDFSATTPR